MTAPVHSCSPAVTAPGRLPLFGHLLQLALPGRMAFVQSLRSHGPVVRIYLGTRPAYVLNSPEALRQLLQVQAGKFTKGRLFEKSRPFIGNGILASDGDTHRRQRRTMQPAFHRQRIAQYVTQMSDVAYRHIESWRSGAVLTVMPEMRHLTGALLSHILFSGELARDMAIAIEETLPVIADGVNWRVLGFGELTKNLPTPGNRRFEATREHLWRTTEELIEAYRADPSDRGDLLSLLLAAPDPHTGRLMSDDELRDEIITIFIAGVETMATMLSWALHILSTQRPIAQRLEEEAARILGGRPVKPEDIPELTYTRAFIDELLRFYTPNLLLMRDASEALEIEGTSIPAGTEVMYSPATLHRDPALYPDPGVFNPDRWAGPTTATLPRCSFIPFSVGNRQCIGDSLAMAEMHVVLAALVAKWRFEPAVPRRVREVAGILIQPPSTLAIRVTAREAQPGERS
ncbi:cytochrome P450 [Streptomyces alanosinicus]|uniref:Cytochrome P450 n=1 Tax=Streptomyces alanosinicus TaxID=68171 RepID=A0A919D5H1_9ACTN|nr:cytochrome P450 [Streptomyces alanosinicus]GHE09728.1 cytochrome P450 [Streptomyces alanosinicus]